MEVLVIIVVLWSTCFVLILKKRGIIPYIPNKKGIGKVTNIVIKHRVSKEPYHGKKISRRKIDIVEEFAVVEFYDDNCTIRAESLFPITDINVGENVVVRYKEGHDKVWITKIK